jgi:hypothetical protein
MHQQILMERKFLQLGFVHYFKLRVVEVLARIQAQAQLQPDFYLLAQNLSIFYDISRINSDLIYKLFILFLSENIIYHYIVKDF